MVLYLIYGRYQIVKCVGRYNGFNLTISYPFAETREFVGVTISTNTIKLLNEYFT